MAHPPRENVIIPENIPVNIIYEDDDLVVVDKEPGMVVHPGFGNWSGTLVNALAYHFEQNGDKSDLDHCRSCPSYRQRYFRTISYCKE